MEKRNWIRSFRSWRAIVLVPILYFLFSSNVHAQNAKKEKIDMLVAGGTVVTMNAERRIIEDGAVAVNGDTIEALGSRASIEAKYTAAQTINAGGKLVLPGFINGHTHVPMTLLRGLRDDVTLDEWLRKYIFPAEAKNVTEEFVRRGTRLAAAEQIRGGVTTFADMYYFEDVIAEEAKAAGMRGVLGETILDFPAPDNKSNAAMLEYTEKFLKRWPGDALIHAAHCIWVDEADRKILAQRQVGCVHNPSSNMMLASGVAPLIEERAAGVAVGLGTDGPAGSNNDLDLMEEMDLAAKLQKITRMDPQTLGAKAVVEMATIEGARALHMEKEIGSLEPGKKADFILIGLDAPNAVPMYDVYAQLAYALKGSDVETVIIGGRVVMRDKKLLTVDEAAVIAKAREFKNKIEASLK